MLIHMPNKIPNGLRNLRSLAFIGLFLTLINLFQFVALVQQPISLVFFVIGVVFYISLISAINKRSRKWLNITFATLIILILSSVVFLIALQSPTTAIRLLIEIIVFGYLWKEKQFFSA